MINFNWFNPLCLEIIYLMTKKINLILDLNVCKQFGNEGRYS